MKRLIYILSSLALLTAVSGFNVSTYKMAKAKI